MPFLLKIAPRNSFGAVYRHLDRHNCLHTTGPETVFVFLLPFFVIGDLTSVLHMMWTADLVHEEERWQSYYAAIRALSPQERANTLNSILEDFESSGMM
jgi:hypothetical protein